MAGKPQATSIARTFDQHWKLDPVSGCHIWQGYFKRDGYGYLYDSSVARVIGAHRFAYRRVHGEVDGLHICHHCDNKACVNEGHLFAGTNTDNRRDSVRKGRAAHGERHGLAKISRCEVALIRQLYQAGGISQSWLGRGFGISQTQVGRIVNRKRWASLSL
jgi:hypothetical protein